MLQSAQTLCDLAMCFLEISYVLKLMTSTHPEALCENDTSAVGGCSLQSGRKKKKKEKIQKPH